MTSQLNVDTIVNKAGNNPVAFTKQEGVKARLNYNDNTPAIITDFSKNILARDSLALRKEIKRVCSNLINSCKSCRCSSNILNCWSKIITIP